LNSYLMESTEKKSRIPARLDFAQSATGLILGLFISMHILLEGSIILGKDSYAFVAKNMELAFLSDNGHGFPITVFFAALIMFTLFITHALLGIRKFPISWKQHRIIRDQMQMMKHQDTNLWYVQALTGFIMFFVAPVHLYIMLSNPGTIDPYLSADRIVSGNMWFLYLTLLICVVFHAAIGLYRLCMKWGWFAGKDARKSRLTIQTFRNRLTIFYLSVGILALLVFVVIGIRHKDKVGERYIKHVTTVEHPAQEQNDILDDKTLPLEGDNPQEEDAGHQAAGDIHQEEGNDHQEENDSSQEEGDDQENQPADITHPVEVN
jgi:fumarate reductase subunit C